jgi:hypothetical protein
VCVHISVGVGVGVVCALVGEYVVCMWVCGVFCYVGVCLWCGWVCVGGVYRVSVSEQRAGCGLAACGVSE